MNDYTDRLVFVIAMPRSRTAWLCEMFKPYMVTWHDPLKRCESIDELGQRVDRALFNTEARAQRLMIADTAACFFMPEIVQRFPGAKFIVIERPYRDVCQSLSAKGVFSTYLMSITYGQFSNWDLYLPKNTLHISYAMLDLRLEDIVIHTGLLDGNWNADRWNKHKKTMICKNVQIPFPQQNAATNWPKVRKLMARKMSFRFDSRLRGD